MFKSVLDKAKSVASSASTAVVNVSNSVSGNISELRLPPQLEQYQATIESAVVKVLGDIDQENRVDDVFLTFALGQAYGVLPFPVRLVVGEDDFIKYFISQKNVLMKKMEELKGDPSRIPA